MSINLKTLIGKLNDTCRNAATRAASICVGLGQYEVDQEHLLLALLENPRSDMSIERASQSSSTCRTLGSLPPFTKSARLGILPK